MDSSLVAINDMCSCNNLIFGFSPSQELVELQRRLYNGWGFKWLALFVTGTLLSNEKATRAIAQGVYYALNNAGREALCENRIGPNTVNVSYHAVQFHLEKILNDFGTRDVAIHTLVELINVISSDNTHLVFDTLTFFRSNENLIIKFRTPNSSC